LFVNGLPNQVRQSIYAFQAAYSGLNLNQGKAEQSFVGALAPYKIVRFALRRTNAVLVQI
jgi:hypothetical protein